MATSAENNTDVSEQPEMEELLPKSESAEAIENRDAEEIRGKEDNKVYDIITKSLILYLHIN